MSEKAEQAQAVDTSAPQAVTSPGNEGISGETGYPADATSAGSTAASAPVADGEGAKSYRPVTETKEGTKGTAETK